MYLLLFLLLAAPGQERLELVNDIFKVVAGEERSVYVTLQQEQAVIEVSYRVRHGDAGITAALIGPGLRNSAAEGRTTYLRLIPDTGEGKFRFPAAAKGEYQISFDGRGLEEDAEVELEVVLDFEEEGLHRPGLVSRGRRYTVIALSLLFFFAVAFWSGSRILLAIRRRPPSSRPLL